MDGSPKNWVCYDCKYLGLCGDVPDCNSKERYSYIFGTNPKLLLPEARSSVALSVNETDCNYKVQGNNGVFDRGIKA